MRQTWLPRSKYGFYLRTEFNPEKVSLFWPERLVETRIAQIFLWMYPSCEFWICHTLFGTKEPHCPVMMCRRDDSSHMPALPIADNLPGAKIIGAEVEFPDMV